MWIVIGKIIFTQWICRLKWIEKLMTSNCIKLNKILECREMGKQFGKVKKTIAVLMAIFFVVTLTAASASAVDGRGWDRGGGNDWDRGGGHNWDRGGGHDWDRGHGGCGWWNNWCHGGWKDCGWWNNWCRWGHGWGNDW